MKTTMSQGEKYIDVAPPQAATAKHLAEEYRAIGDRLRDYRNHRFQVGAQVQVNDPRFNGIGVVTMEDACPPDKLPLILESGNVWWYPIENCTRIATTQKAGTK